MNKIITIKLPVLILIITIMITALMISSCSDAQSSIAKEVKPSVSQDEETSSQQPETETTTVQDTGPTATLETEQPAETDSTTAEIKNGEVTFITEDGIELNGNIFGQGNRWVILSHMYPTDQTSWFDFAGDLGQKGYVALTFDFRGYGKSGGKKDDIANIYKDIAAAISFVKSYGPAQVFLVGASMGGTASIIAASMDDSVSGVVTLAAPDKMGDDLDALSVVSKLGMPKIFISAIGDEYHAQAAKLLYEKAVDPKAMDIMENSKEHGTFIFENEPENAERLKAIIINFLDNQGQ
jgi:pimeloyl-ACP methyl ester carboxylesterase